MEGVAGRALLVLAFALVVSAAGCGGDGADADRVATVDTIGKLPNPGHEIDDPPIMVAGDLPEVQEVVDDVQDALLMLSGWGICREITSAAQDAVAPDGECEAAYDRILRKPEHAKRRRLRSKVVSVEVGPAEQVAIAVIRTPGRPTERLRLVDEGGRWTLPRVVLRDKTGLDAR